MIYYILFIQEIKDIILNSKESPRLRDPLNRRTCRIEKTRTDPAGSKLTEPNSGNNPWTPCHGRRLKQVEVGFQSFLPHLTLSLSVFFFSSFCRCFFVCEENQTRQLLRLPQW